MVLVHVTGDKEHAVPGAGSLLTKATVSGPRTFAGQARVPGPCTAEPQAPGWQTAGVSLFLPARREHLATRKEVPDFFEAEVTTWHQSTLKETDSPRLGQGFPEGARAA